MRRNSFVRHYRRIAVGVTSALVFVLVPAAALASGSPTDDQYAPVLQQISVGGNGPPPSGTASAAVGTTDPSSLPFTGLDVVLLAAVAVGLMVAGLLLRRQRPNQVSGS